MGNPEFVSFFTSDVYILSTMFLVSKCFTLLFCKRNLIKHSLFCLSRLLKGVVQIEMSLLSLTNLFHGGISLEHFTLRHVGCQKLAFIANDFTCLFLEGYILHSVFTTRYTSPPSGQTNLASNARSFMLPQFAGDKAAAGKPSAEQRAEFERANALAKQVRPLLPLSVQLAFPVPEHRQGVIAAHMRQMMVGLRGLIQTPDTSGMVHTVDKLTKDASSQDAIDTLTKLETHSLGIMSGLGERSYSEIEKFTTHMLLLPQLPKGSLLDAIAEDTYNTHPLFKFNPLQGNVLEQLQSEALKGQMLNTELVAFEVQSPLFLNDPYLNKWLASVASLSKEGDRETLLLAFLEQYDKGGNHAYAYSNCAADTEKVVQQMIAAAPSLRDNALIQSLTERADRKTQEATTVFQSIVTQEQADGAVSQLKEGIAGKQYLPTLEESQAIAKKLGTASRIRTLIEETPADANLHRMAINRIVLQVPNKPIREGLFAAALLKSSTTSIPSLVDLGSQLQQFPNRTIEKQLFVQTILSSNSFVVDYHKLHAATNILMNGLPDPAKAATIMGIVQFSKNNFSLALAKASILTLKNNVLRQSLLTLFASSEEKKLLANFNSLRDMTDNEDLSAYFQITQKAFEQALAQGLSISSARMAIGVIQAANLDPGVFNRDIMPDYCKLLAHTLKNPDKLVKAGDEVPSQETIKAQFKSTEEAHAILAGLVLLGRPAMEMAVERKRLDNVLASVRVLMEQPETFPLLVACKQKAISQFDMLKIAEMSEIFIAQKSCDALFSALKQVAEQPTLDLAPLAKATLEEVMKKVNVSVDNIDPAQLERWNLEHISTLVKAFTNTREKETLTEVCRAALQGKFKEYLYDPNTELGKANLATKAAFEAEGLNFEKWQNYTEVKRVTMPSKIQYARTIEAFLLQEYSTLSDEKRAHFDSDLQYLSLAIAENPTSGKKCLMQTKENQPLPDDRIVRFLSRINSDKRALQRLSAPSIQKIQAMISTMTNRLPESPEPLEIAVWDRNPGYDMFMGTDTGACTAIDKGNMSSIHALQNTFVQMVHLRKPGEKKAVGKILLFWSKNPETGALICHWNTFEGRGGAESKYEDNYFMREELLAFVEEYAKAVSGKEAVPIRTCNTYNPTYKEDLATEHKTCKVIGHMKPGSKYYLDTFSSSEVDISRTFESVKLWKMNAVEIEAPKPPSPPPTDDSEKKDPDQPIPPTGFATGPTMERGAPPRTSPPSSQRPSVSDLINKFKIDSDNLKQLPLKDNGLHTKMLIIPGAQAPIEAPSVKTDALEKYIKLLTEILF